MIEMISVALASDDPMIVLGAFIVCVFTSLIGTALILSGLISIIDFLHRDSLK